MVELGGDPSDVSPDPPECPLETTISLMAIPVPTTAVPTAAAVRAFARAVNAGARRGKKITNRLLCGIVMFEGKVWNVVFAGVVTGEHEADNNNTAMKIAFTTCLSMMNASRKIKKIRFVDLYNQDAKFELVVGTNEIQINFPCYLNLFCKNTT